MLPLLQPAEQKRVKIQTYTKFTLDGEEQVIELTVFGDFYKKARAYYLKYEEVHEEGKMNTVIKLAEEDALIMRSGILKMRMQFCEAKKLKGTYETPYGNLSIATKTKRYQHQIAEPQAPGKIDLLYDLTMEGSHTGTYHLQITYEEANDEHR